MMIAIKDDAPNGAAVTPPIAITRARSLPRRRSIGRDALTSTLLGVSFAFDRVSISISAASATFVAAHFAPHRRRAPFLFFFLSAWPGRRLISFFSGSNVSPFRLAPNRFCVTHTHTHALFVCPFGCFWSDIGRHGSHCVYLVSFVFFGRPAPTRNGLDVDRRRWRVRPADRVYRHGAIDGFGPTAGSSLSDALATGNACFRPLRHLAAADATTSWPSGRFALKIVCGVSSSSTNRKRLRRP